MKKIAGRFIIGAVTTLLVISLAVTVFAAPITRTLTATFRDIKISVDNKVIELKDANGNKIEPFIVDGTTYLPVRSVAEAVGYDVSWNDNTNTVILTTGNAPASNSTSTTPPTSSSKSAQTGLHYEFIYSKEQLREVGNRIYWSTLIEIENTGTEPLEIRMSGYDLTDESGKLLAIGSLSMVSHFPSILYPGEKGIFVDSTEIVGINIKTKVNFKPRWDMKTPKAERINLNVSDIDIREGKFGTSILGRITNNTGKEQTIGRIEVLLYADDGTPIGVAFDRIMENMPNGSSFGFDITIRSERLTLYENITPDMIASYIVYAYTGL